MEDIRDRIATLIEEHDTTLVFVNTRRMAERLTHDLGERLPAGAVLAHHGSLAREVRLEAERRLQTGEVRAIVATASLELGIDIGSVNLVCQLGSPRSIAVALQRVGRSGHWLGTTPKGRFFPTTRDELVECAALVAAVDSGDLDRIRIPRRPSTSSHSKSWRKREPRPSSGTIWTSCSISCGAPTPTGTSSGRCSTTSSPCFRKASRPRAGGAAPTCTGTPFPARCAPGGGARLAAIQSGGAIPETAQYQVVAEPEDRIVANSTRTSPSRATGATSSCSGPPPGGSGGSPKDRSGRRRPGRGADHSLLRERRRAGPPS